jgi:hypothetical protein
VLLGEVGENGNIDPVLDKAISVLGHAEFFEPICNLLHGGHQTSRRGMTEFSTSATASLYQSICNTTPLTATFAVVSCRFQGVTGISVSVDPCDSMGQHNAKLMSSQVWPTNPAIWGRWRSGHQNRDCGTARSNRSLTDRLWHKTDLPAHA